MITEALAQMDQLLAGVNDVIAATADEVQDLVVERYAPGLDEAVRARERDRRARGCARRSRLILLRS